MMTAGRLLRSDGGWPWPRRSATPLAPVLLSPALLSPALLALALLALALLALGMAACASAGAGGMTGTGGSLARFAVQGDHLYALAKSRLLVFSLQDGLRPTEIHAQHIGWDVETLFLSESRLFVGARNGMYIYDVSVPETPRKLAFTGHLQSCDPVVVRGDTAFVTLRKGSECRRGTNELQVYDVSDPTRPALIASYPMHNPWGLGVDGDWLFVADGKAGLRVFDARDPRRLRPLETHRSITGYDVIPNRGVLIISAEDGLYQYEYRGGRMSLLSRLPIARDQRAVGPLQVEVPPLVPPPGKAPPPEMGSPPGEAPPPEMAPTSQPL